MTVVKATLMKHQTADGLVEFHESIPLGQAYLVVIESRRTVTMFNGERLMLHDKEIIDAVNGRWLPVECLRLEVN